MHHDLRARQGDERARVQDLRAVVRRFGRLSMMELGNQPGVGHHLGIGGQDAGHVLPQHDARGAEGAGDQCRRQVRSSSSERRHARVGCLADEPWHDGHDAVRDERAQDALREAGRLVHQRARAAVLPVGANELPGIDVRRAATTGEHGGENGRRRPFATRDEQVARVGRQPAERRRRAAELEELARGGVDQPERFLTDGAGRQQLVRDLPVTPREGVCGRVGGVVAPRRGVRRAFQQQVGDAGQRRGHHDERAGMRGDQCRRVVDRFGIGQRGAAELPHFERRLTGGRHRDRFRHGRAPAGVNRSIACRTAVKSFGSSTGRFGYSAPPLAVRRDGRPA